MSKHDERWDACPAGELQRMVARQRQSQRQVIVHRATSALAVLLMVAAGAWLSVQLFTLAAGRSESEFHVLTCSQVRELLSDYGHGVLATSLEEKIAAHLHRCEHCNSVYRNAQRPPSAKIRS